MTTDPNHVQVKPITPGQARVKQNVIPSFVIASFNSLIEKEFDGHSAVINQDDAISAILKAAPTATKRAAVFDNHWLDVEGIFEAAGWSVVYEKPAYNETGPVVFTFTPIPNAP